MLHHIISLLGNMFMTHVTTKLSMRALLLSSVNWWPNKEYLTKGGFLIQLNSTSCSSGRPMNVRPIFKGVPLAAEANRK